MPERAKGLSVPFYVVNGEDSNVIAIVQSMPEVLAGIDADVKRYAFESRADHGLEDGQPMPTWYELKLAGSFQGFLRGDFDRLEVTARTPYHCRPESVGLAIYYVERVTETGWPARDDAGDE